MTRFQRNTMVLGSLALSLTVLGALTYPAYLDAEREQTELTTKKKEYQTIVAKMAERDRLGNLKRGLESDINSLRNAVPKAPYLDLLMLDLERMARVSNVQILALEQPAKENGATESNDLEDMMLSGGKTATAIKPLPVFRPTPGTTAKAAEAPNPLGLKQISKRLFVTGEYQNIIAFVKHLESYQRVIALKDLSVAIAAPDNSATKTAAGERAQKLKLDRPIMSFLLNVYYLPE